jgi:hypothetical protein
MTEFQKLDDGTVKALAAHWQDGWNDQDLDRIMTPMAQDVVFSSPGIALMTRDPSRTSIEGYDALRAYIEKALKLTPGVRYDLQATYAGTDSLILTYSCGVPGQQQKLGADSMRVNGEGKIVEWRCHY